MKPISGIVNSISELIGQLTLPTREKKELEIGLLKLIQELERELTQARAVTVQEFIGNRVGRVRGGKEWGKNHAGIRTKTTLILDLVILDFSRTGRMLFDFILNFTF